MLYPQGLAAGPHGGFKLIQSLACPELMILDRHRTSRKRPNVCDRRILSDFLVDSEMPRMSNFVPFFRNERGMKMQRRTLQLSLAAGLILSATGAMTEVGKIEALADCGEITLRDKTVAIISSDNAYSKTISEGMKTSF